MNDKKANKSKENNSKVSSSRSNYDKFKDYKGQKYTGMSIGRSHSWHYDPGNWKEKKQTPDLWEFTYNVKKKRAGHAPEGSGVPVGTEYHWYILAHQIVHKIDENTYSTAMSGLKYKIAHKRSDKENWNITHTAQRKRLMNLFKSCIHQLELEELAEANAKKAQRKRQKPAIPLKNV